MKSPHLNRTTSSMTAFGAAKIATTNGIYHCEIRCVNHRFLDVHFRLPEELRAYESDFRELLSTSLNRGRVDCSVKREELTESATHTELNTTVLSDLLAKAKSVADIDSSVAPLSMAEVLRWPGVMSAPEVDEESIKTDGLNLLQKAIHAVKEARLNEGQKLHQLIGLRVDEMRQIVDQVQARLPELSDQYRKRLEDKLESVKESMEESRIEQEMVLFLNKTDVMEELDRLNVHFDEVVTTLNNDKPKGRRLDFLMQELNRETNTLGSKSQDAQLTQQSVELKVLVEQMREQVQNIE